MKCLLTIFLLLSAQAFAINARIFDESRSDDKLSLSMSAELDRKRKCINIEMSIGQTASFYQGEPEEQSGEEGYVEKVYSGISVVKYIGTPDNAYTLMHSGASVNIESTPTNMKTHKSSFCVHESDIDSSYVLINYFLEQTCPELIYIPVREIYAKYGKKI